MNEQAQPNGKQRQMILLIVLAVVVIGAGAAYYFFIYSDDNTNDNTNLIVSTTNANQNTDQNSNSKLNINVSEESLNKDYIPFDKTDTDNDSLYDAIEMLYGTDINEIDSDGDGIDDYDEVISCNNPNGTGQMTLEYYKNYCDNFLQYLNSLNVYSISSTNRQIICDKLAPTVTIFDIDSNHVIDAQTDLSIEEAKGLNQEISVLVGDTLEPVDGYYLSGELLSYFSDDICSPYNMYELRGLLGSIILMQTTDLLDMSDSEYLWEGGTDADSDQVDDINEYWLGTDNSKEDSDGDGYSDYEEVMGCYNPVGQGKMNEENFEYYCTTLLEQMDAILVAEIGDPKFDMEDRAEICELYSPSAMNFVSFIADMGGDITDLSELGEEETALLESIKEDSIEICPKTAQLSNDRSEYQDSCMLLGAMTNYFCGVTTEPNILVVMWEILFQ